MASTIPPTGNIGLRVLSDPDKAIADVVFVHGLTGNLESTWTDKKTKIFWPPDLLPTDLPRARILTFGYGADIIKAIDATSSNTIRDHGKSLAFDLSLRRMKTKSNTRPIIFVAHSLGGLVTEQALLICRGSAESHMHSLLDATYAIAFMGTPHVGSDLARWGSILTGLANLVRKTNKEIVRVLEPGSEMLATLQQEFHTMVDARQKADGAGRKVIKLFCFYEELPVQGVGEIVQKHSAILSAYPSRNIHGNHMSMTKFTGKNDAGYECVSGQLWLWVCEIESQQLEKNVGSEGVSKEGVREVRAKKFGALRDIANSTHSGNVNSTNGMVIIGSQTAGRDVNFNSHNSKYD